MSVANMNVRSSILSSHNASRTASVQRGIAAAVAVLVACAGAAFGGDGIVFSGVEHLSRGGATVAPSLDGRRLHIHNLGSSGQDGVEIKLRSAFGGGVTVESIDGAPVVPGAVLRTKYKGWDGTIKGVRTTTTNPGGGITHTFDYSGLGATSIDVVTLDGGGHVLSKITFSGAIAVMPMPQPCPAGSQWGWPKWYDLWYGGTHYLGNFCNDPINPIGRIVVTPHFPPGSSPDMRMQSMIVEAAGVPAIDLSEPSYANREAGPPVISEIVVSKARMTGLGAAHLAELCDNGVDCDDPAQRKLVVSNIGSSGQDGVEVKFGKSQPATSGSFLLGDVMHSTGEATMRLRSPSGLTSSSLTVTGSGGSSSGQATVHPDFSSEGSTQFMVTGYLNGQVVTQTTLPNGTGVVLTTDQIVCGPNSQVIYGWVTMWVYNQPYPYAGGSYQTYWGVTGCIQMGGGNGLPINYTDRVVFSPVNPTINTGGTASASITGRNLPQPITVLDIGTSPEPTACPAAGMVENFDNMIAGPVDAYPCWSQWDGLTDVSADVSVGTGISGGNSLKLTGSLNPDGNADNVVRAVTITGGRSTFTTSIRVPSGATGASFIALMDQYSADALHLGAWLVIDGGNNTVRNVVNNLQRATLVRDQWIPVRVEIDLDADTVAAYYNNQPLFSGQSWRNGTSFPGSAPVGLSRIIGVALFAGDGSGPGLSEMYFDDMSLLPALPPACLADVNSDGVVDGGDFIAFINSFATGDVAVDPVADVNHDLIIDGDDFISFINAFSAGC